MYKNTWIIVANGSKAIFYEAKSNQVLEESEVLENPMGRLHGRDIVSDKPGKVFDRVGEGRHAMEPKLDVYEEKTDPFAREIVEKIKHLEQQGKVEKFFLCASPEFLGEIREKLHVPIHSKLAGTIHKDLTQQTPDAVRRYLPEVL